MGRLKNSETRIFRTGAFFSLPIDSSWNLTRTDDFNPSTAQRSDSISVRLALPSDIPLETASTSSSAPTRPTRDDNREDAVPGFVASSGPHSLRFLISSMADWYAF